MFVIYLIIIVPTTLAKKFGMNIWKKINDTEEVGEKKYVATCDLWKIYEHLIL